MDFITHLLKPGMRTQIVTEQILGEVFYSVTIQGEADVIWLYLQLYVCNLRWCHVVTSYWGECNSRMVRSEHIARATPLHLHMVCNYCVKIDLNRIRNTYLEVLFLQLWPSTHPKPSVLPFASAWKLRHPAEENKPRQFKHWPNSFHDITSLSCVSQVWALKCSNCHHVFPEPKPQKTYCFREVI